jgi:hypothetical protein
LRRGRFSAILVGAAEGVMDENSQSNIPARRADLTGFVSAVIEGFDDDPAVSLARLEETARQLDSYRDQGDYQQARGFLAAARNLFLALQLVQTQADFATAVQLLEQAKAVFAALELEPLAAASEGLRLYFSGIVEIRRQNAGRAIELLNQAPQYLREAGDFGARFRPLIDHMAPDQLFAAGVVAVSRQDFALAKTLLENAAQKAEHLAEAYYTEGSSLHVFLLGLGKLYRAYFATFKLWSDFARFDLEWGESAQEAAQTAREARELIGRAGLDNPIRRTCYRLAGVLSGIVDVLPAAALLVRALLEGRPSPELDFPALRQRLQEAENEAAATGEEGVVFVRVCAQLAAMLDNLRRYDAARPQPAPPVKPASEARRPTRLFVMMPFSDEGKIVESALLRVFEQEPYWFDVILARDRTLRSGLFDNVKAHMDLVDGFVADISDLNPNVMLELGMAENDPRQRPVFVLRREGSKEPPSDLKGRLYVEYALPPAAAKDRLETLAQELRQKLEAIEDLRLLLNRRQARYLSENFVRARIKRARLDLDAEEIAQLRKAFQTAEELEAAGAALIGRKTGFDAALASRVAAAFKPKVRKAARAPEI